VVLNCNTDATSRLHNNFNSGGQLKQYQPGCGYNGWCSSCRDLMATDALRCLQMVGHQGTRGHDMRPVAIACMYMPGCIGWRSHAEGGRVLTGDDDRGPLMAPAPRPGACMPL
jgi:hypothetical protein